MALGQCSEHSVRNEQYSEEEFKHNDNGRSGLALKRNEEKIARHAKQEQRVDCEQQFLVNLSREQENDLFLPLPFASIKKMNGVGPYARVAKSSGEAVRCKPCLSSESRVSQEVKLMEYLKFPISPG